MEKRALQRLKIWKKKKKDGIMISEICEMAYEMIICISTFQELPLDKEGMGLRKFGTTLLLFWRERERD